MKTKIGVIDGIGPVYAVKLMGAGIKTVEALLNAGATKAGRQKLAEDTGIVESKILTWVNMADLFRIKGIGPQYAELLEVCGVDTIKELRTRNAENLHTKMTLVYEKKRIIRTAPSLAQVMDFIEQANALEPMVSY